MGREGRRLPWYGWLGGAALAAGEIGLAWGLYPVQVLFYLIAWWSYILLVDAWVWRLRGHSLLRNRRWEFLVLGYWSIALWNLFEVFNLRLQNWFYVNVPAEFLYGALMSVLAYATVLPGIFETYELLGAAGLAGAAFGASFFGISCAPALSGIATASATSIAAKCPIDFVMMRSPPPVQSNSGTSIIKRRYKLLPSRNFFRSCDCDRR